MSALESRSIPYWYAYAHSSELGHEHHFTTDPDSLPCDALYVKRFATEFPIKLWSLIQRYALQNQDYIVIENDRSHREYWHGHEAYASN